jgi:DNA-binding response OmpR family regulator
MEDSRLISEALETSLVNYGYITKRKSYDEFLKSNCYVKDTDVLIINIDFEISDKLLEKMRNENPSLALVGLNTTNNWTKKLSLLKNGFDEVLDYPFPSQEMIVRIENILKRPRNTSKHILGTKTIQVDTRAKRVMHNKSEIQLRKKEFCLLEYLVRNKNRTVSRNELLDHVWDYNKINSSNTVDVHVKRLRDKIDNPRMIQTVHGFGYRIND